MSLLLQLYNSSSKYMISDRPLIRALKQLRHHHLNRFLQSLGRFASIHTGVVHGKEAQLPSFVDMKLPWVSSRNIRTSVEISRHVTRMVEEDIGNTSFEHHESWHILYQKHVLAYLIAIPNNILCFQVSH